MKCFLLLRLQIKLSDADRVCFHQQDNLNFLNAVRKIKKAHYEAAQLSYFLSTGLDWTQLTFSY